MYTKHWAYCTTGIVSFLAMPDSCLKLLWNFLKMSKTWIKAIVMKSQHVWWDNLAKVGSKILLKLHAGCIRINSANYLNGCWIKQTKNSPENFWIQVLGIYWMCQPRKFTFFETTYIPQTFSAVSSEGFQLRSQLLNFCVIAKSARVLVGIKLAAHNKGPLSMTCMLMGILVWDIDTEELYKSIIQVRFTPYFQIHKAPSTLIGLNLIIGIV